MRTCKHSRIHPCRACDRALWLGESATLLLLAFAFVALWVAL